MKKYVIIGNGAAAVGAIEGIRSVDKSGEITVISRENRSVYARPLISYYLEGKTDLGRILYRPSDFYEKNSVTVLYGEEAVSVDPSGKTVSLGSGKKLGYDSLCVATGSTPFVPPTEGLESVKNVHTFMTLDDAEALKSSLTPDSKVLIVGAGLIGLKCAEGILNLCREITVCDLAPRVLSSILDQDCAAIMQAHLEKMGIKFLLGDTVEKFDETVAHMKSGCDVSFDALVMAVGVRANISLIKDIGGECGRGIAVNEKMQTSLSGIYAAGDCTESFDITSETCKVMAIMPLAYMQGHCAGVNMSGGDEKIENAFPMNSIGFAGLHCMTAGSYEGECLEERFEGGIKRLYVKDNLLKGFILIGKNDRAGIYTALIRNKTPLDSVDFELLKKSPALAPFGRAYRSEKLGGVV